jgi:molybdenum cofactor cytidylyltransferase
MQAAADASVIALVLAAGSSQRYGSDKRRACLADGSTLLNASLAVAQHSFARVAVVLRADDEPQQLALPDGVQVIRCLEPERGMGHSLAVGVAALSAWPASAIAVMLGDMPWIAEDALRSLCEQASSERIVYPLHRGQRGHPVLFGSRFWPELQGLSGDQGAREVLLAHADCCVGVNVEDPGVLADVDTPAALGG